ncbi:RSM23 (YGL129C) [Zygosaccharomyces parabailii]|nr:RSM23 (YGL129C) [Zygosaccharomyces parabailii]CDH14858.1 related to RSM23-Mitochondrial ribosomal protein,small subunit [Zygosaccharomyces bailii ISA1307]
MLRLQSRQFSSSVVAGASPVRGKAQGFAKKTLGSKKSTKRIAPDTLHKNWQDTIHTAGLSRYAVPTDIPTFKSNDLQTLLNKVAFYSSQQYRSLYHLGAFKKNQFHELFPKPISLLRESSTQKLISLLRGSANRRFVLTGEPGVGKTVLLTQIQAYALDSGYILVNFSHPDLFLDGRNDFFYHEKLGKYVQPMYLKALVRKILRSNNEDILRSVTLQSDYKFSNADPKDASVKKFVNFTKGKNSLFELLTVKTHARNLGTLFEAVITELSSQKVVPVLFSVDNFSRMLTESFSAYKDVNNQNIPTLELQVPNVIMQVISGDITLSNDKSCVILATSGVDKTNKTLPVGLGKLRADPYLSRKYLDIEFSDALQKGKVQEFEVPKLKKNEVKELVEFYLKSELFLNKEVQSKSVDQLVNEKYFLSGNGNPRELLKSIVLMHM